MPPILTRTHRQGVNIKEARADDLHTRDWTFWPEDVLDTLDLLLVYVGVHERLARPQVTVRPLHWKKDAAGRRCIHPMSFKAASLLIHFWRCRDQDGKGIWYLCKGSKHEERLRSAGINPDTVQVEDKDKWAIAWWQLTNKTHFTFKIDVQKNLIAKGFKAPEPKPWTARITYVKKDAIKRIYEERKRKKALESEKSIPEPDYENEPVTIGSMLKASHRDGHDLIRMR